MKTNYNYFLLIVLCTTLVSCKDEKNNKEKTPAVATPEKVIDKPIIATKKAPIVNIADTLELKQNVLCFKDSAATEIGLKIKLARLFSKKLTEVIKQNKIKATGQPMAWFSKQKPPYFFEAGIPVDKTPPKMGKGMYMKSTGTDSAFIAHYWGPNELKIQGYDALNERIKDLKKNTSAAPYEIYKFAYDSTIVNGDAYKLETTIVMPFKKGVKSE